MLTAAPAAASEPAPASRVAAEAAAETADLHCADVTTGAATESAEALAAVSLVLAQVSRAHDASGATYLLYWRGLLNACVGLEERSVEDLSAFLAGVGDDAAYAAQVEHARGRLRRLRGELNARSAPPRAVFGVVFGGVLLGAGGTLAGLSGWQGQATRDAQAAFASGTRPWVDTDTIAQQGEDAAATSNALAGASIGTGVAGAVVIVVAAATASTGATVPAVAVLVPRSEGGVCLQVGGRW